MMSRVPRIEYFSPRNLEEAIDLCSRERGTAKILAGGTDLLVRLKKKEITHRKIIGLKNIPDLDYIVDTNESIQLGPLVTHDQAARSPVIRRNAAFFSETCSSLGSYHIRCMGTVAGNVCNASPSADTLPSLLVLEARLRLVSKRGERVIPIGQFFLDPFKTALDEDEILASIEIPQSSSANRGMYMKIPKVTEKDETLVGVAVLLRENPLTGTVEEARIGLGSVAPVPIRAARTESYLRGKNVKDKKVLEEAANLLVTEISPRSRAEYRKRMAQYLFSQAVHSISCCDKDVGD